MQISLHDMGKRYNREWIFRHVSLQFAPGIAYAITGPNGSGKSTLLQVIAGAIQHNEGKIDYYAGPDEQSKVSADLVYHNIAIAAPYLDLVEEMTALNSWHFMPDSKNSRRTMEAYYRKRACPKPRINRSVISAAA